MGSSTNLQKCFLFSGLFILPAPGLCFFHFLGSCFLFDLLFCQPFFPHLKHTQLAEYLSFRRDSALWMWITVAVSLKDAELPPSYEVKTSFFATRSQWDLCFILKREHLGKITLFCIFTGIDITILVLIHLISQVTRMYCKKHRVNKADGNTESKTNDCCSHMQIVWKSQTQDMVWRKYAYFHIFIH